MTVQDTPAATDFHLVFQIQFPSVVVYLIRSMPNGFYAIAQGPFGSISEAQERIRATGGGALRLGKHCRLILPAVEHGCREPKNMRVRRHKRATEGDHR